MDHAYPPSMLSRLSYLLGRLYHRALELEAAELQPLGLGVKQHALLTVLDGEGPMTQQELGQRVGIDRTTIVAVVDGLEESGFVERRRSPADRRAYQLLLTAAGKRVQKRGQRIVDAAELKVLAGLEEDERLALIGLLSRAVQAG